MGEVHVSEFAGLWVKVDAIYIVWNFGRPDSLFAGLWEDGSHHVGDVRLFVTFSAAAAGGEDSSVEPSPKFISF